LPEASRASNVTIRSNGGFIPDVKGPSVLTGDGRACTNALPDRTILHRDRFAPNPHCRSVRAGIGRTRRSHFTGLTSKKNAPRDNKLLRGSFFALI
tara:strand:+ start:110 stop:397 length:288 start_codon:yes stop_codon:yes gene_type:complete